MLSSALVFAAQKHADQRRKTGIPYLFHPMGVMRRLHEMGCTERGQVVALLHDIYEDTDATEEEMVFLFGKEVSTMVSFLSKNTAIKIQSDRLEEYILRLEKGIALFPEIMAVKISDQLDNLNSLSVFSLEKQKELLTEIREEYMPLYRRYIFQKKFFAFRDLFRLLSLRIEQHEEKKDNTAALLFLPFKKTICV